tara:strand:- start:1808 stop:2074 length:267 start_codon:yes stop_codon:yes gene_type:complete
MIRKCKTRIYTHCFLIILGDTPTAEEIWKNLPIKSNVQIWGEEIYFNCSIISKKEKKSVEVLKFGEYLIGLKEKFLLWGSEKLQLQKK